MADGFGDKEAKTVLRPTPGVRRPTPGGDATRLPVSEARASVGVAIGGDAEAEDFVAPGRNPLLAAAGTILVLGARLKSSVMRADLTTLRSQSSEEMARFTTRARASGVSPEIVDVASYVLCTFFDTSVMRTPWGARGEWGKYSLLVAFHNEAFGGENFFRVAERALADPPRNLDLLELLYTCIALGYEGKYAGASDGRQQLNAFQQRLFRAIRDLRGEVPHEISVRWQGTDAGAPSRRLVPAWAAVLASILIVFSFWVVYRQLLNDHAAPVLEVLARPAVLPQPLPTAPMAVPTARLRPLLASEESARRVTVEEQGDRTVIVLNDSNLFASGSADLGSGHERTVEAIASAIDAVPGRVIVVGHTDDQRLRSFRFSDNFALSRARADALRNVLQARLKGNSQIEISGAGSTQPRFLPAELPENRARNRRVELIHIAQGARP